MPSPEVEVRRSRRRRRTVTAYRDGARTVVLIPSTFSADEEQQWVGRMLERLARGERRRAVGDRDLDARAARLSRRYLGGHAQPTSVSWVSTMERRWASCTPSTGTIRVSDRLRTVPSYVLDYVVLHELAHLLVSGHGPAFWRLLASYPRLERARGFLDGLAHDGSAATDGSACGDDPAGGVDEG